MTEQYRTALCINGHPIIEYPGLPEAERGPCPECGSKARQLGICFGEGIGINVEMKGKVKHSGIKKPSTVRVADEVNHDTGKPVVVTQVYNRVSRTNTKKVIATDGTVIKDVQGPLEDQSLHGKQPPKDQT